MSVTARVKDLPPYPANGGTAVASQLRNARRRYQERLAELEEALAGAEAAFAVAFERSDASSAVRDRIGNLAADARRRQGRLF